MFDLYGDPLIYDLCLLGFDIRIEGRKLFPLLLYPYDCVSVCKSKTSSYIRKGRAIYYQVLRGGALEHCS